MSPDIPSLCVDPENTPEASTERGHGRPVTMQEVVIVFQPLWQDVKGNDPPTALPDLQNRHSALTLCCHAFTNLYDWLTYVEDILKNVFNRFVNDASVSKWWQVLFYVANYPFEFLFKHSCSPYAQTPPSSPLHGEPAVEASEPLRLLHPPLHHQQEHLLPVDAIRAQKWASNTFCRQWHWMWKTL